MAVHEFSTSAALMDYVHKNDVTVWYGQYGMGTINFIDCKSLHIAFDSRSDYEKWKDGSVQSQISLF